MTEVEIFGRVERRRKSTPEQKAALMAEVAAEGGRVAPVARRHRIAESLLYNWRAAWRAAASAAMDDLVGFVPVGMIAAPTAPEPMPAVNPAGTDNTNTRVIEIVLPDGVVLRVGMAVSEETLSRVLRSLRAAS